MMLVRIFWRRQGGLRPGPPDEYAFFFVYMMLVFISCCGSTEPYVCGDDDVFLKYLCFPNYDERGFLLPFVVRASGTLSVKSQVPISA